MARVKRAVNAHKKRRVTLERASGYRGQRSRLYRKAKEQVTHSLVYSYRDRKAKKGDFRKLWIQRINAAARAERHDLQPLHPGPQGRGCRGGPQDPGRPGRQRPAGLRRARRDRQGRAARGRQRPAGPRRPPDRPTLPVVNGRSVHLTMASLPADPPLLTARSGRVKTARRLARRASRAEHRLFLAEGPQAVREALALPGCVREVFAVPAAADAHPDLLAAAAAAGRRLAARRRGRRSPRSPRPSPRRAWSRSAGSSTGPSRRPGRTRAAAARGAARTSATPATPAP